MDRLPRHRAAELPFALVTGMAEIGEREAKERYCPRRCPLRGRAVSEAVAAAQPEHRALDQLAQLIAEARVLDVVLARQIAEPAAWPDLDVEGQPPIRRRRVRGYGGLIAPGRLLRQARLDALDAKIVIRCTDGR